MDLDVYDLLFFPVWWVASGGKTIWIRLNILGGLRCWRRCSDCMGRC